MSKGYILRLGQVQLYGARVYCMYKSILIFTVEQNVLVVKSLKQHLTVLYCVVKPSNLTHIQIMTREGYPSPLGAAIPSLKVLISFFLK